MGQHHASLRISTAPTGAAILLSGVLLLALAGPSSAQTTYYVRTDGGTAGQCTGTIDAPYPGSGNARSCAWNHPFWALPPGGAQPLRMAGGDTLLVGPGSYRIGYGAPNTGDCDAFGAYDCTMATVPGGPTPTQPTRILGAGWDGGCPGPPELWGAERAWQVLDLEFADNVLVACLEITDRSGCIEHHSGPLACHRDTPPYGSWAPVGIFAADSSNVVLRDLDIHGLAETGVRAGRLHDWTVERVRIAHNGWAGWDGDIPGADHNTGDLVFRRLTVEWNGCGETWPGGQTVGCWAQSAGGYGDGLGTGVTTGDWLFEEAAFLHNTSDGLDLLYLEPPGTVEIRRTRAEGNAGNQIKTRGDAVIADSVVVGNCAFFEGRPFTFDVDNCRAAGNALSIGFDAGTTVALRNNTLYSEGDCILLIGASGCDGSESLTSRNNIFVGGIDFLQPWQRSCLAYNDGCPGDPLDQDWGIIHQVKGDPCPVGGRDLCGDPMLVSAAAAAFDGRLRYGSPGLDSGLASVCPGIDHRGLARPQDGDLDGTATCDRGAYEAQRPATLDLRNRTVHSLRAWEACTSLAAGGFQVESGGRASLQAGRVGLEDGFAVAPGGELVVHGTEASACP